MFLKETKNKREIKKGNLIRMKKKKGGDRGFFKKRFQKRDFSIFPPCQTILISHLNVFCRRLSPPLFFFFLKKQIPSRFIYKVSDRRFSTTLTPFLVIIFFSVFPMELFPSFVSILSDGRLRF